jgi:hypothetical protein
VSSRAERPGQRLLTSKQLNYIRGLRRNLYKIFGSQTPSAFMQDKEDESLNVIAASILINQMKKMVEDGTPPTRPASKSEGSGYEEGPVARSVAEGDPVARFAERQRRREFNAHEVALFEGRDERDVPLDGRNFIRVWKKHPNQIRDTDGVFPEEYWGWCWVCFHPDHRRPIEGASGRPHPVTLTSAMQHWKKYHQIKE